MNNKPLIIGIAIVAIVLIVFLIARSPVEQPVVEPADEKMEDEGVKIPAMLLEENLDIAIDAIDDLEELGVE